MDREHETWKKKGSESGKTFFLSSSISLCASLNWSLNERIICFSLSEGDERTKDRWAERSKRRPFAASRHCSWTSPMESWICRVSWDNSVNFC
jgi:hypothetical protein